MLFAIQLAKRFPENVDVPIDNNRAKNAIKPFTIKRKN